MSLATKLWLLLTTVLIGFSTQAQDSKYPVFSPYVAEIRPKAEAGDPEAQNKLGGAYEGRYDKTNAIFWYRKAARQGHAGAQYRLSHLLPAPENLKWLKLSANQGNADAAYDLGRFDQQTGKKEDRIEAYKWFTIANKKVGLWGPTLDSLALTMPQADVIEAQKRAAAFVPTKPTRIEPELKLQSIIGTANNRLALINGHTFKAGEQAQLKIDDETVSAKCIGVTTRTAVIEINGTQKTLSLP